MRFGRNASPRGRSIITGRTSNLEAESPLAVMQQERQPGERLIWADRPVNMWSFSRQAIPIAIFGIPFLAFALFWTWMASIPARSGTAGDMGLFAWLFPMFGIPFILAGGAMFLSPLLVRFKGRRMVYGLTDKRVIIRDHKGVVTSFPLAELDALERRDNGDGTGDLVVRKETHRRGRKNLTRTHGFYGIPNPQQVEHEVGKARHEATRPRGDVA